MKLFNCRGSAGRSEERHCNAKPLTAVFIFIDRYVQNLRFEISDRVEPLFPNELFKLFSEEGDDAFFWKTLLQKVLGGYDGLSACVILANGIAVFNYHFFFPSFLSEL